jgi:hypothetical protein
VFDLVERDAVPVAAELDPLDLADTPDLADTLDLLVGIARLSNNFKNVSHCGFCYSVG